MLRLAMLLYSLAGTTLAGSLVIVALVAGYDTARGIIIAALLGFVLAVPASLLLARKLAG